MKLSEKYKDRFAPQIIGRGVQYFKDGEVSKCFKTEDGYISKVAGSYGEEYTIKIKEVEDGLEMSCTCPYQDNCKHEYATLLTIDNKKFKEIKLLPEILENTYNAIDFIKAIPSEELKTYILKKAEDDELDITEEDLKEKFVNYLPKESKEYFYNNLYNICVVENILPRNLICEYISRIRQYVDHKDYGYAFTIITAIIDAVCDSKVNASTESLIEIYSKLGMFARISYRKGSQELKDEYNKWISKYAENNYNDDVYLEDLLITIK